MEINRFKNFIGLCACKGCRNRFINRIKITFNTKGGKTIKAPFNIRKYWLCDEHTWELAHDLLKAGGEMR